MKKIFILLSLLMFDLMASAQVRTSLYEQFTSENYGMWYPTNPLLNALLSNNSSLVIPIKWQVPLPTAPVNSSSLYQTNKAEINWRYRSSTGSTVTGAPSNIGYGYESQNTATDVATNGINSGMTGRFDGQHQWAFGAGSDDPADVTGAVITSAQTQTTNFRINLSESWNTNFSNCAVTVTVSSTTSFTSLGALMLRLCLVEREITYATPPGINGEQNFYDAVRKSYPTTIVNNSVTATGTQLFSIWAPGQTQVLTISCNIPTFIRDLSQMAFVAFVQDDGDRKVYQAARTPQPAIPNDIDIVSLDIPLSCTGTITPSVLVHNLGPVAITAMTIQPYIDGTAKPIFNYVGNIPGSSTISISLPSYTAAYGKHTFSTTITGVSGGDINPVNNTMRSVFGVSNIFTSGVAEPFATFPPTNWYALNYNFSFASWMIGNAGGFGSSPTSAKFDFYNILGMGEVDDLFFPALNLTGVSNPVLTFDVAYAQFSNQNDKLDVLVSTNCGASWTNVYSKQGTALSTAASFSSAPFVPTATEWRAESVNLSSLANQPSVLVKFVATSDFGNNLYVDNVNLGQPPIPTSVRENSSGFVSCQVFPNPTSGLANISINLPEDLRASIAIINNVGQLVYATENTLLSAGNNNININTGNWPSGIYFVSLTTPKGIVNTKLNVAK